MLQPTDDRVAVKLETAESKTSGGLIIPDTVQARSQKGTVVAVGPGKLSKLGDRLPVAVSIGDKVFSARNAGTEVKLGGEILHILHETDILAILADE